MIRALIFDFDGLILDTEMPSYLSWVEVFNAFDCELSEEDHAQTIGAHFDRLDLLKQRTSRRLPPDAELHAIKKKRHLELLADLEILPGVVAWLDDAARLGLPLAVASSSSSTWVTEHLRNFELLDRFAHVVCCEDGVPPKPSPDCYVTACERLGVEPSRALAVEDSGNGIAAAKAAGLWCVAVPNTLTIRMDLSAADVRLESLAGARLEQVIARLPAPG